MQVLWQRESSAGVPAWTSPPLVDFVRSQCENTAWWPCIPSSFYLGTETLLFSSASQKTCVLYLSHRETLPGLYRKWITRHEQGLGHTSFSASSFRAPGPHQLQPPLLLLRKGLLHKVDDLLWLALPAVSPALCFVLQEHTWQQPLQQ